MLLAVQGGGRKKKNQRAHSVVLEKQRREMQDRGAFMPFRGQVKIGTRSFVFHSAWIFANCLFDTPDNLQFEFDGHMMGQRNTNALWSLLQCRAWSAPHRSVWLACQNTDAKMQSEAESKAIFAKAEKARGSPSWGSVSKETGAKGMRLAETGDPAHGLEPLCDQSVWRRMAHETMHENGIVCNSFRAALVLLFGTDLRKKLALKMLLVSQPIGTKPLHRYVRFDNGTWVSYCPGEKLMSKEHWRRNRMIHDLIPGCDGDPELLTFVETWHLFMLIEYMPGGVSFNMLDGWRYRYK